MLNTDPIWSFHSLALRFRCGLMFKAHTLNSTPHIQLAEIFRQAGAEEITFAKGDLIRTIVHDEYCGSMKITTHLNHRSIDGR